VAETLTMPKLGFDMAEGTLVNWTKAVGDTISKGDVIAEIETDKATIEIEAQHGGTIRNSWRSRATWSRSARRSPTSARKASSLPPRAARRRRRERPRPLPRPAPKKPKRSLRRKSRGRARQDRRQGRGREPSPTRRRAGSGSGPGGGRWRRRRGGGRAESQPDRASHRGRTRHRSAPGAGHRPRRADRQEGCRELPARPGGARRAAPAAPAERAAPAALTGPSLGEIPSGPDVEVIDISRLRQRIGQRMVESKQYVPHFYVTSAIDVTALLDLRSSSTPASKTKRARSASTT